VELGWDPPDGHDRLAKRRAPAALDPPCDRNDQAVPETTDTPSLGVIRSRRIPTNHPIRPGAFR
jgi:hypothetical protein